MTSLSLVSSGTVWQIKDLADVAHSKVLIHFYPETNPDTSIGESVFTAIAIKYTLDGSTLTHEKRCMVLVKQVGLASWAQGPITNW